VAGDLSEDSTVAGFSGLDGARPPQRQFLLDENGHILCKTYQLSNGNSIQERSTCSKTSQADRSAKIPNGSAGSGHDRVREDILKDVFKADVGAGETVAHTESALKFYEDPM